MDWPDVTPTIEPVDIVTSCAACACSPAVASTLVIVGAALGSVSTLACFKRDRVHHERTVRQSGAECATSSGEQALRERSPSAKHDDSACDSPANGVEDAQSEDSEELGSTSTAGPVTLQPVSPGSDCDDAASTGCPRTPILSYRPDQRCHTPEAPSDLISILAEAQYRGHRFADGRTAQQLLDEIHNDDPAHWTLADYQFVTQCRRKTASAVAQRVPGALAAHRELGELKQDMAEHSHISQQATTNVYHAREDRRRHNHYRGQERKANISYFFILLFLELGFCFAWCFQASLFRTWNRALLKAPRLPPLCLANAMDFRCILPYGRVISQFVTLFSDSLQAVLSISEVFVQGSVIVSGLWLFSGLFSFMSVYAARGNVIVAPFLSCVAWYLTHLAVAMFSKHQAWFYTILALYAAAYACILLDDWLWPEAPAEQLLTDKRRRGEHGSWSQPHRLKLTERVGYWLEGLAVPRDTAIPIVNFVLMISPVAAVLGSLGR